VVISLAAISLFIQMDNGYGAIASIFAFEIIYNATFGPVHWLYLPEVLNDTQFGFIATIHYSNAIEIAFTTEWLIEKVTPSGVFLVYTVISFLGLIFMWFYIRETQGLADW
jgi:hypothetical protein